jgi:hypothetical protein
MTSLGRARRGTSSRKMSGLRALLSCAGTGFSPWKGGGIKPGVNPREPVGRCETPTRPEEPEVCGGGVMPPPAPFQGAWGRGKIEAVAAATRGFSLGWTPPTLQGEESVTAPSRPVPWPDRGSRHPTGRGLGQSEPFPVWNLPPTTVTLTRRSRGAGNLVDFRARAPPKLREVPPGSGPGPGGGSADRPRQPLRPRRPVRLPAPRGHERPRGVRT